MSNLKYRGLFLIFSIILPLGLLTTFRIAGVTRGPVAVSDTIRLDAATMEFERPDHDTIVSDANVNASFENGIRISAEINANHYLHDWSDDSDLIKLTVNLTATLETGFIRGVNITFWEDYEHSYVDIDNVQYWPRINSLLDNLTVIRYGFMLQGKGLKDFVELGCLNESKNVRVGGSASWFLHSPQNNTHAIEIDMETIYYNGSVFKQVIQPFMLRVGPDDNNAWQTAMEITEGNYSGLYISTVDAVDFYKIHANLGQKILLYVDTLDSGFFNLTAHLYDDGQKLIKTSEPLELNHTFEFISSYTGYWYIRLQSIGGWGFYRLGVSG